MPARNQPCPCGSGKKFKHCHGLARPSEAGGPSGGRLFQQAQAALAAGNWDQAIALAERAPSGVRRSRCLAHALISRRGDGDLERARTALRDWAHRLPRDAEPRRRLLEADIYEGRLDDAMRSLLQFAERAPSRAEVAYYEGILRQLNGEPDEAMSAYGRALAGRRSEAGLPPLDDAALDVAAAMQRYEIAAGNYPGSGTRQQAGMFDRPEDVQCLESRLLAWEASAGGGPKQPGRETIVAHADAWYNLGCAAMAGFSGHEIALRRFDKALTLNPEHVLARLNAVFTLNYSDTATPKAIFNAHRNAGTWLEQHLRTPPPAFANERRAHRRLRVGYLSSDFRNHSVAHFILPVLRAHDRERIEIYAYYTHGKSDGFTDRIRELSDVFRAVPHLTDTALRQRIIDDRVDILIDLNGLTERNRMAVLAMRAAPVQINWIGYPNTTGLTTMDYRLVDANTDPPGTADAFATERLLRLDPVFSVYGPPQTTPEAGPPPFRANGSVTFGSFNAMPKLNEPLLQAWAAILHRVPRSRMLLKNVALGYESQRRLVREAFARHGIEADRLKLAGHTASQHDHLAFYQQVDLCLDSFPYNGTTTTCEALHMGVPVVSRAGPDHRSRVAFSQLAALGLESLVASDENSLVEIAVNLAADTERLASMRATLRERLQSSPLTDAEALTGGLEDALSETWAEWCRKEEKS